MIEGQTHFASKKLFLRVEYCFGRISGNIFAIIFFVKILAGYLVIRLGGYLANETRYPAGYRI